MSGGSYDYAQFRLDEWAGTLESRHAGQPHVLALAAHLRRLGEVMRQIEWADSGDTSWDGGVDAAVRSVLAPGAELGVATERALDAHARLAALLADAAGGGTSGTEAE